MKGIINSKSAHGDAVMKVLAMEIVSKGCASCVLTIKPHLLRTRGVVGVRTRGSVIYVLIEDWANPEEIIRESGIEDYYRIKRYWIEEAAPQGASYSLSQLKSS